MNKFIKNILEENDEENIDDFFKPKNLKSREEKYLKDKEKHRNIYFSFFDQMDEPERSRAKAFLDINNAMSAPLPCTISDAIVDGIDWVLSPGGVKYWGRICTKYE